MALGRNEAKVDNTMITIEEAIKIANQRLREEKFDINKKNIFIDKENTKWNVCFLSNEQTKKNNPDIFNKLEDKEYWAINYTPKEMGNALGGEAWVFVDKQTGRIISLFYLK